MHFKAYKKYSLHQSIHEHFQTSKFVFNVPPTAKVIWRQGLSLKSHLTNWRSWGSNLLPLVYKTSGLSTTPQRHLFFKEITSLILSIILSWKCSLIIAFAACIRFHSRICLPIKQTLWTLIRLLLMEQSDLGLYCLQYRLPIYISRWGKMQHMFWMVRKWLNGTAMGYMGICSNDYFHMIKIATSPIWG